jgi:hypothetical protein
MNLIYEPLTRISYSSSRGYFVRWNGTFRQNEQVGLVPITSVQFQQITPSSLSYDSQSIFCFSIFSFGVHFVQWWICQHFAQLWLVLITPVFPQSHKQFDMWKSDTNFLFYLWWPFFAAKQNMLAICTTRCCTYNSCNVWFKSRQQFDLWKQDKVNVDWQKDGQMAKAKTIMCSKNVGRHNNLNIVFHTVQERSILYVHSNYTMQFFLKIYLK